MDSDKRSSSTPRKVKYAPIPPCRAGKPPQAKSEAVKEGDADEDEKRALLPAVAVQKHLAGGQTKAENKSAPKQVAFSHVVASSTTSIGTHGGLQGGTDEISNDKGLKGSASADGILENVTDPLLKKKKKEYKEPWDYRTNYPTILPWRKPFSGDPDLLDEDEFGEEAASAREYDERNLNDASDLGLLEKVDDAKMYLFQIPATIPYGGVGKMLVYKSGVVKLKMGDFLFLVSTGIDSSFHQEIMPVNTNEKQCCSLGKPNNTWAVVTPDIE